VRPGETHEPYRFPGPRSPGALSPTDPRWALLCRARVARRAGPGFSDGGFSDAERRRVVAHGRRLGIAPIHAHEIMDIARRMDEGSPATPEDLAALARVPVDQDAHNQRPSARVVVALLIWSLTVFTAMMLV